jgi:anti-sigma B factor antagonist
MEPRVLSTSCLTLRITPRQVGDVWILDCVGRITSLNGGAYLFRDNIKELIFGSALLETRKYSSGRPVKLLINLSEVTYIDSTGIGETVYGFTQVADHGGQMKVLGMKGRGKDLFQITKLYTVFDVYEDEATAVRSFADQG